MKMAMTQNEVAIGVFASQEQARQAIDELERAGFEQREIGYLVRTAETEAADADRQSRVATGAIGGGVLGGVLGAAASLLVPGLGPAIAGGILAATFGGLVIGAAAGGVVGALTNLGVSEDDARFYQAELEAGRTIVTVKNANGAAEAADIMRRNGAYNAATPLADFSSSPLPHPGGDDDNLPGATPGEQIL